jgi:hypothetical protein
MRSAQEFEPYCPRLAQSHAENGLVPIRGFASILVAVGALAGVAGTTISARAGVPAGCDSAVATRFHAAAERYAAQRQYANAAAWYLAATRATSECRAPSDAIARANSLFAAGTAFALSGDSLRGLSLLHAAQSQLTAMIDAGDRETAPKARAILALVVDVIAAIDTVAKGSM